MCDVFGFTNGHSSVEHDNGINSCGDLGGPYFPAVVPLFSNRTFWIARKTGVDVETIVEWTAVDSDDSMKVPVLIGCYKDANASETSTEEWSTMAECRQWIAGSSVSGELSDREKRM